MLANGLNLSIDNSIVIYSFLALYGVITLVIAMYVHAKFRVATKSLNMLKTEWDTADSRHAGFLGAAHEQISKLAAAPAPAPPTAVSKHAGVGPELRNQVVTMAKRGIGMNEIARACGLQEGEIEVLLGMARLQR